MMNKVYEIKRADMLNIKEYTVWKHADEEVWEVDDGKTFAGSDSLAMVERKQVIEFDYEGQHYRIYRKEGDVFGKNECLDYMTFKKTVCVAYHRFTEDDFVHITFKDAETDVEPAVTLPKGWNWAEHIAGDGYLESPSGKAYFCYTVRDWEKEELIYSENINGTRVEFYTGFEMFKEYAETKVRDIWGEMLIKADNAWDYFKEYMGIGEKKKLEGDIMKRYLVFIKDCYIRDAQALLAGKTGLDNDQSEKEESWRDIAAPVLIMDRYFEDPTQLKMLLTQLYPEADPSIFMVYTVDNMEEHGLI